MKLTREEARSYQEDDEDPGKVFAAFDAAEREGRLGVTAPQGQPRVKLRDKVAAVLRHLAKVIESPHSGVG
jgi:hypothetical protein